MTASSIIADLIAVAAMVVGFHMVFRQQLVRKLWRGPDELDKAPGKEREDDPVHYALSIFGMMLLAFGLTIFGFVTTLALLR